MEAVPPGDDAVRLVYSFKEMPSWFLRLDVGWSRECGFHFHFANGTKPNAQRAGCGEPRGFG